MNILTKSLLGLHISIQSSELFSSSSESSQKNPSIYHTINLPVTNLDDCSKQVVKEEKMPTISQAYNFISEEKVTEEALAL